MRTLLILFFFSLLISSCSLLKTSSVNLFGEILTDATKSVEAQNSLDDFEKSTLANLQMAEGLFDLTKNNKKLLMSLIKGYSGYAFVVDETNWMEDSFNDLDFSIHKVNATLHYTKAIKFAEKFLSFYDINYKMLITASSKQNGIEQLLDSKIKDSDETAIEAIIYFAQALVSYINLKRDKISLIAQLPVTKGVFDWGCKKKPDIGFGLCDIFYASYYAGRPKMLGGQPSKGKKIFKNLIVNQKHNWLARVVYIQNYLIPMGDKKEYLKQKFFLENATRLHRKNLLWSPNEKNIEAFSQPAIRLYQALAIKRFKIIKKFENDLF